jgi:hypothetical protein
VIGLLLPFRQLLFTQQVPGCVHIETSRPTVAQAIEASSVTQSFARSGGVAQALDAAGSVDQDITAAGSVRISTEVC